MSRLFSCQLEVEMLGGVKMNQSTLLVWGVMLSYGPVDKAWKSSSVIDTFVYISQAMVYFLLREEARKDNV